MDTGKPLKDKNEKIEGKLLVGITGGIGSGKSYVCEKLLARGFPVYDCDKRAKSLMVEDAGIVSGMMALVGEDAYIQSEPCVKASTDNASDEDATALSLSLNKKVIADFLFHDERSAARINSLVHPAVLRDFLRWAGEQSSNVVFIESAILLESVLSDAVDKVVVVCAPDEIRIERAMQRDHSSREKIEERIRMQSGQDEQLRQADFSINNDGCADIDAQLDSLFQSFELKNIIKL
jgi:dephospho-CoA kinase